MNGLERAKKKLDKKIAEAAAKGDFIRQIRFMKEKQELDKKHIEEVKSSLASCLSDYTDQERREATVEIVYTIALADILSGAIMDVLGLFKKRFDIDEVPMLKKMAQTAKTYQEVVKTIDDIGSEIFSNKYMDIVDEVEMMCNATLKNSIHAIIIRSSKNPKA